MTPAHDDPDRSAAGTGAAIAIAALGVAIIALIIAVCALAVAASKSQTTTVTPSPAPASTDVAVTLTDYKIGLASTTISPTNAALQITNSGAIAHELLVFSSALAPADFPKQADGSIDEEGAGITKISDGDNLDPGARQTRTIDLTKPGTYVFVCNLPGHYAAGMYTTVTVK